MANSWHVGWLKEGVKPWNARRKKIKFSPDLRGINFRDYLPEDFRDSPKASRFFEKINLSDSLLQNADLSNLNFQMANFSSAVLTGAKLDASNFQNTKFVDANLTESTLTRADFGGAKFTRAKLEGVEFTGVEGFEIVFEDSPLTEFQITNLEKNSFIQIIADGKIYSTSALEEVRPLTTSRLMPSVKKTAKSFVPPEDKNTRFDVFYGTNRLPRFVLGELKGFGGESGEKLHYGICEVIIPKGHKIGSLVSKMWGRLNKRLQDDRLKIKQIIGLDQELFWTYLNHVAGRMRTKERPTLFVHGYNNSFDDAVLRAAQIGFDLGLGQGIGLFSWPSAGKGAKYAADEATVDSSKYYLADFIEEFVTKSEFKSINVIAHSMGCRCFLGALEVLSKDRQHVLRKINQIILAAADVDTRWMDRLGHEIIDSSTRTTSYVSGKDKALSISKWLHDYSRIGIVPPTYVINGMDTVLVNRDDLGAFGHGYFASSRTVISDMFSLLKWNTDPKDRHSLKAVIDGSNAYWKIKE